MLTQAESHRCIRRCSKTKQEHKLHNRRGSEQKRAKNAILRAREQIKRLRKSTREEDRVLKQTPCFQSLEDFEEDYIYKNDCYNWHDDNDYSDEDYFEQLYKNTSIFKDVRYYQDDRNVSQFDENTEIEEQQQLASIASLECADHPKSKVSILTKKHMTLRTILLS